MATRINLVKMEFYHGAKEIACYLGIHLSTCYKHLRRGRIPAKKDSFGRWVLCNLDYYRFLEEEHETAG